MIKTNCTVISVLSALALLSGSASASAEDRFTADLDLRTFYMNRDFDQGIPDTDAGGQAFTLKLQSPYYGGLIGFDLRATHVAALHAGKKDNLSNVLAARGKSYSTLEDAYIKLRPLENLNLRAGRMVMATPLLNSQRSRLSAGSVQAIYGEFSLDNLNLFGFYADQASLATSQDFTPYSRNGEEYGIHSIGGGYHFENGLNLFAQFARAEDYLKQAYLNVTLPVSLAEQELTLDLIHMRGEDDGELYGRDYNSNLTSLTGRLSSGNLTWTANYQRIGGDDGYALQWGGQDDTQYYTWGAVQVLDFNAKDEQSLQLRVDYDLPSVPGLHLMARHTESWDIDAGGITNGKRQETNFDVSYTVQSGQAKDLSLRLRLAHIEGDAVVVPRINDLRLIMDYPVNLF